MAGATTGERITVSSRSLNATCKETLTRAERVPAPYLGRVLVGCSEGAVGVGGVQAGPVHVAVSHVCLLQHVLKALDGEVNLSQVLQELLGVKVGPLQRVFFPSVGLNEAVY